MDVLLKEQPRQRLVMNKYVAPGNSGPLGLLAPCPAMVEDKLLPDNVLGVLWEKGVALEVIQKINHVKLTIVQLGHHGLHSTNAVNLVPVVPGLGVETVSMEILETMDVMGMLA